MDDFSFCFVFLFVFWGGGGGGGELGYSINGKTNIATTLPHICIYSIYIKDRKGFAMCFNSPCNIYFQVIIQLRKFTQEDRNVPMESSDAILCQDEVIVVPLRKSHNMPMSSKKWLHGSLELCPCQARRVTWRSRTMPMSSKKGYIEV